MLFLVCRKDASESFSFSFKNAEAPFEDRYVFDDRVWFRDDVGVQRNERGLNATETGLKR